MAGMVDMKNRKKDVLRKVFGYDYSGRGRRKLWITYFWDAMFVE